MLVEKKKIKISNESHMKSSDVLSLQLSSIVSFTISHFRDS